MLAVLSIYSIPTFMNMLILTLPGFILSDDRDDLLGLFKWRIGGRVMRYLLAALSGIFFVFNVCSAQEKLELKDQKEKESYTLG